MRHSTPIVWAVAGLALALAAFACVLNALAGSHGDAWWLVAIALAAALGAVAVGGLVVVRRRHPIGWILLATGVLITSFGVAAGYAEYALREDPGALPGAEWAVQWDQSGWPLLFAAVVAIAFLFPDGRLPSPGWRKFAIGAVASFALLLLLAFFDPEPYEAPFQHVDKPVPTLPDAAGALWPIAFLGVIASLVAGARAIRLRFRRSEGIERLQLKWLAFTSLLVPVTLLVCLAGALLADGVDDNDLYSALFFSMLGAFPASVGVAILRYRLYDIDRIINRTLVYGVLTVLLAGTYAATTLLLGTALGSDSAWATAGATLLVAVAFRPLRARIQDLVDRRFSRARYDGLRRIGSFLEDLRAGHAAPEDIEPLLRDVLGQPDLELRFWLPESELYVDAHGRATADSAEDARLSTPITRAGAPLGMVVHRPLADDQPDLLEDVVEAAGLAVEIARLRVELRRQLDEVEASRARIVSAGYEERRRLERDLHDGAQQRLVSIGLALRHAQHELGTGPNGTVAVIDGAVDELGVAIDELRELARGVRPAQLDAGLAPALRELAARASLPVDVEAGDRRFAPDLEAAAYFIASEGLTNAVKHAQASRVTLRAGEVDGRLVVSVADDGVGGASAAGGSGLRGLGDRVQAHGGTLRVESDAGAGTTLVAELPCES